jgi:hypothetical protein
LPQAVDFLILKVCAVEATAEDRSSRGGVGSRPTDNEAKVR